MLQGGTNDGASADERNAWLNQNCVLSAANSSAAHLYQQHSQGNGIFEHAQWKFQIDRNNIFCVLKVNHMRIDMREKKEKKIE